jgi:hypothetical protein
MDEIVIPAIEQIAVMSPERCRYERLRLKNEISHLPEVMPYGVGHRAKKRSPLTRWRLKQSRTAEPVDARAGRGSRRRYGPGRKLAKQPRLLD